MSQLTNLASGYAMTSNVFFAIRGILSKKVRRSCFTHGTDHDLDDLCDLYPISVGMIC